MAKRKKSRHKKVARKSRRRKHTFRSKPKAKKLDLHRVVYASDGEKRYRVFPISRFDALVTLKSVSRNDEETGERVRIPVGDLLEFYSLIDMEGDVVHEPKYEE